MKFSSIIISTITFLLLFNSTLQSQSEPCGTETVRFENYAKLKTDYGSQRTNSDYTMPIKLHIITEDNGNHEVNIDDLINEISVSNVYFGSTNIELNLCGIDYINNSNIYHFDKSTDFPLITSYNESDVLNMYIVETIVNQSGNSICGTASYPWASLKIVILKNSCSNNSSTMAHEIGHYLGLYHTHTTSFGSELADQSNCGTAGDLICDTPADPQLSFSYVNSS